MSSEAFIRVRLSNPAVRQAMTLARDAGLPYNVQLEMAIVHLDAAYQATIKRYEQVLLNSYPRCVRPS